MNRKQRRSLMWQKPAKKPKNNVVGLDAQSAQSVIDTLPLPRIVAGVNNLLAQLEDRQIPVADWDDKERRLYRLQICHGRVYYLATGPEKEKPNPDEAEN